MYPNSTPLGDEIFFRQRFPGLLPIPTGLALLVMILLSSQIPPLAAQEKKPSEKFPPELVKFTPHDKNPIFTGGGKGTWDEKIRERGWILREGGGFKMWYTGYRSDLKSSMALGYATSDDGIHWKLYSQNPIYKKHWVEDMMVVPHRGTYYMFAEGFQDRAQLLTSKDGLKWKRIGPLEVRLKNGQKIPNGPYGTPTAFVENDIWYLFYERRDIGVWLATSKDLKIWTNVQDEPVLTPGPGNYDRDLIALNQIVKYKGHYYAFYHGSAQSGPNAKKWCTCLAISEDLVHWQKYPGNPLLPIGENKSSGILVRVGDRFRLYTMHPEVNLHISTKIP